MWSALFSCAENNKKGCRIFDILFMLSVILASHWIKQSKKPFNHDQSKTALQAPFIPYSKNNPLSLGKLFFQLMQARILVSAI
jgi:hypothetical protein